MPISGNVFVRSTALLLLVGLVALIGIVGTSLWLVQQTQSYFDVVIEARDARTTTVDLRTSLQDAETGQRGFLLTLDEAYLEPYNTAIGDVRGQFDALSTIMQSYPEAAERLAQVKAAIDFKLQEMADTIDLARGRPGR